MKAYFSPRGGCEAVIVGAIGAAKSQVLVQAYSFTSQPIIDALIGRHVAGLDVRVILDRSWPVSAPVAESMLVAEGVSVLIDRVHAIAHNKVVIVDGATVVTGSFNFTEQAEHQNAENILIIKSRSVAGLYLAEWNLHAAHSVAPVPVATMTVPREGYEFPRE